MSSTSSQEGLASKGPVALICVVEDDLEIGSQLRDVLEANSYRVTWCTNGAAALQTMAKESPDLVLLDAVLPDMSGFSLCREFRESRKDTPVIFVTASDNEIDIVMGLDSGACDYVTKPFTIDVLLARIRAHLRPLDLAQRTLPVMHKGITISPDSMSVTCDGKPIDLRLREVELLLYLCRSAGRVLTRRELFAEIWDVRWANSSKTLDMHIHALRRKLGDSVNITTMRGVGYRLETE